MYNATEMFDLKGKDAVILGGGGILGTEMAKGLASAGANIAVGDLRKEAAERLAKELEEHGTMAKGYEVNAMDKASIEAVCKQIIEDFGKVDILVNAVGGNMKEATTSDTVSFFDLPKDALEKVINLNLMAGSILPCQVFGKVMAESETGGVIINISSMNYYRPLTRTPGYAAAKAAVSNFTQWLAVNLAQAYGDKIRVNAIAPGFFLTDQNRFLLTNPEDGKLTKRGEQIIEHTPMGRFGDPADLIGTLIWLASDASKFVTGVTVPVDGGFSAYSGV
ncbi:MAG TPA: SDR family oxidoreductase [Clostridiaceae bacterium]|nr:SDR family oxidoreductase [Clostridiaceae bacterium]